MQKPFSFSLPDLITFYAAWQYNTGFAMKLMLRLRSAPFTLAGVGGGVRVGGRRSRTRGVGEEEEEEKEEKEFEEEDEYGVEFYVWATTFLHHSLTHFLRGGSLKEIPDFKHTLFNSCVSPDPRIPWLPTRVEKHRH